MIFFTAFSAKVLQHGCLRETDEREGQLRDLAEEHIVGNMHLSLWASCIMDTGSVEWLVEHRQGSFWWLPAQVMPDARPAELVTFAHGVVREWDKILRWFRIQALKAVSQCVQLEHLASPLSLGRLITTKGIREAADR